MIDSFIITDYSAFKKTVEALEPGESNHTFTVLYSDDTGTGGLFTIVAGFATRIVSLETQQVLKPVTFNQDFPKAVQVDAVVTV